MKPPGKPWVQPKIFKKDFTPICVVVPSASWIVKGPPKSPVQKLTKSPSRQMVLSVTELGKRTRHVSCEMTRANWKRTYVYSKNGFYQAHENSQQLSRTDLVLYRQFQLLPSLKCDLVDSQSFAWLDVYLEVARLSQNCWTQSVGRYEWELNRWHCYWMPVNQMAIDHW